MTSLVRLVCGLLIAVAIVPSHADATQCRETHRDLFVLTPPRTTLPIDGGILVGMISVHGRAADEADLRSWHLRAAPAVQPVLLAPGLALYRPPSGVRRAELVGDKQLRARHAVKDGYDAPLPAPEVRSVRHALFPESGGTTTTVELAAPAPNDAIALVLYDGKGRPRTWGRVADNTRTVIVYDDRLCAMPPPGTFEPAVAEAVAVAWVDARGLVSARSAAVSVRSQP